MKENAPLPQEEHGRRTYVFRVSPVLRARALSACKERGCTLSDVARSGLVFIMRAEVDTEFLVDAAHCVDAAGKLLNKAAHDANSCALRFGDIPMQSKKDFQSFRALISSSISSATEASSALVQLRRAAALLPRAQMLLTDEAVSSSGKRFVCNAGVRLTDAERALLRMWPWPPAAVLRLALAVGSEPVGSLLVVVGPSEVALLNRSIVKWRTNARQIRVAALAVSEAQSSSRYLTAEEASECRLLLKQTTAAARGSLLSLREAVDPIAAACGGSFEERGIKVLSVGEVSR